MLPLKVSQIDHVELCVPSRTEAATWYESVLGLHIVKDYEFWSQDPDGPLMISTPAGETKIALFRGKPCGSKRGIGFHLLAFRTDAASFMQFLADIENLNLFDRDGNVVDQQSVVDHELAFSIYFCDPWKNEIEITSYEYEIVRTALSLSSKKMSD